MAWGPPSGSWPPPELSARNVRAITFAPPTAQPVSSPRRSRRSRVSPRAWLLLGGVALAATALALSARLNDRSSDDVEWDDVTAPLALFVEQAVGESFDHPVPVRYLGPAAFDAQLRSDVADVSPDVAEWMKVNIRRQRALGLRDDDPDPLAERADFIAGAAVAFYDDTIQEVVVRGARDDVDVSLRVVLVHELAHALQDQTFGIAKLYDDANVAEGRAVQGIIEGHASWIEELYIGSLSPADRVDFEEASRAEWQKYSTTESDLPVALEIDFAVPYTFGKAFVAEVHHEGGVEAVLAMFDDLPTDLFEVLQPERWAETGKQRSLQGASPPGFTRDDVAPDDLYPGELFAMLAPVIGGGEAVEVVDAVRAPAARLGVDESRACVVMSFEALPGDAGTMIADALNRWVDSRPSEAEATFERGSGFVIVHSCDPGPDHNVALVDRTLAGLFTLSPAIRTFAAAGYLEAIDQPDEAECVAAHLIEAGIDVAEPLFDTDGPSASLAAAMQDCD